VPAASPFKSMRDVVAFAKANPGKLNVAHTGVGGLPHLTVELLKARAGIDVVGVPYKSGGESVTAVLAGQVDMTIEGITILLPLIRDGRLRALAVTSRARTPLAPDLPTMIEAGVPVAKPNSPAEFAAFMAAEHRKWSQLAASAHIKLD
jgi:tripartite-type tricarboxylate transporter receptor subunit TctC